MGENKGFVKTVACTSQCWIPVNAHAPVKDCTEPFFFHYCVFVWPSENDKKTQHVDAEVWKAEKSVRFQANTDTLYSNKWTQNGKKNRVIRS